MNTRVWVAAFVAVLMFACVSTGHAASPFERPDGAVRELVDERTAFSRAWQLADGRRVTQTAGGPVQWQDESGRWREFRLDLAAGQGAWTARSGLMEMALPNLRGNQPTSIVVEGERIEIRLLDAGTVAGEARPTSVRYDGVKPGVDAISSIVPEGLNERLVLAGPTVGRSATYRFSAASGGLEMRLNRAGAVIATMADRQVFRLPRPGVIDAHSRISDVDVTVQQPDARTWDVTLAIDQSWFEDDARAWPVTLSSTVWQPDLLVSSPSVDCQFARVVGTPSAWCGQFSDYGVRDQRVVGWHEFGRFSGLSLAISGFPWLRFDTLTVVQDDAIVDATLRVYRTNTPPLATPVRALRLRQTWDPTYDWSAVDPRPVGQFAAGGPGWASMDLTEIATQWQAYMATAGREGLPNHGIVLTHHDRTPLDNENYCVRSSTWSPLCDVTLFASTVHPDPALRPVLEVTSEPRAPVGSVILSPREGQLSGRRVVLEARALRSSVATARFQYVAGRSRAWRDVPLRALSTMTREPLTDVEIPVEGQAGARRSRAVVWDLAAMEGGEVDGPVHVRAMLTSPDDPHDGGMTPAANFRLDRRGIDGSATESVGPGEVNLLSGELTIDESDVTVRGFLHDLALSRTYRSRGVNTRNGDMFGPQWEANVDADGGELPYKGIYNYTEVREEIVERYELDPDSWNWEAFFETFEYSDLAPDVETIQDSYRWEQRYAVVELSDGSKMTFTQAALEGQPGDGWTPDPTHPGYTLERSEGSGGIHTFTLREPGGAVAIFRSQAADSPSYQIESFRHAGSTRQMTYEYAAHGTRKRLVRVRAPHPSGGTGRSLQFVWSDVPTPGLTGIATVPRVTAARFDDGFGTSTTMASYSYDTRGRLASISDPRVSGGVPTTYVYDSADRLVELQPPGENAYSFTYDTTIPGDSGPRLTSVRRAHPDGGTATTSIRYGVPIDGPDAPHDLSVEQTARWAQNDDLPWDAVAIFPEDTLPSATDPDYDRATIHYLGLHGRVVNTALPGGAIGTAEYDGRGNPLRTLSAANRERALAAGADSARVARQLSTRFAYDETGIELRTRLEPRTQIQLSDGTVVWGRRLYSAYFNENAPRDGGPFHLETRIWRAVELDNGTTADAREILRNEYDGGGWEIGKPTRSIQFLDGGRQIETRTFFHPSLPLAEETRTPGSPGGGTDANVQFHQYYGVAASSRVPAGIRDSSCSTPTAARPAGLTCLVSDGNPTRSDEPRRWFDYNPYGDVSDLWESRSLVRDQAPYRRTQTTFDAGGRELSTETTGGLGISVPATTFGYDTVSGKQISVTAPGRGTLSREYDSNGNLARHVDPSGTVATYSYDLRGRVASVTEDGSRQTRYGYDDRDLLTSVESPSLPAPVTATYDADGRILTEQLPNGLRATISYDEAGLTRGIRWEKIAGCRVDCLWVRSDVTARDVEGNITGHRTLKSQQRYRYDAGDRLIGSDDVRLRDDRCVRSSFAYDLESNRTRAGVSTSAPGAACGTAAETVRTWSHDAADRVTGAGWVHDEFGRATAVPGADAGGQGGALTVAYFADDMVQQMTMDGRTSTYTRDPLGRTATTTATGGSLPATRTTNHYLDSTDAPATVRYEDGTVVRNVDGASGSLAAIDDGRSVEYQLKDVHGSVVATASADPDATEPLAETEYDAFGGVTMAETPVLDPAAGRPGNGWLGGPQRTTEFGQAEGSAGPIQMGSRVYLPAMGRFLQVDPVDGGSANAYDYSFQNPLNVQDLDGECPWCGVVLVRAGIAVGKALLKAGPKAGGAVAKAVVRTSAAAIKTGLALAGYAVKRLGVRVGLILPDPNDPRGQTLIGIRFKVKKLGVSGSVRLDPPGRGHSSSHVQIDIHRKGHRAIKKRWPDTRKKR